MKESTSLIPMQCISQWNGRDPSSLSNMLQELLAEYRSHHRALACQYQRLNFELQTLLDHGQFKDVDVHCIRKTDSVSLDDVVLVGFSYVATCNSNLSI